MTKPTYCDYCSGFFTNFKIHERAVWHRFGVALAQGLTNYQAHVYAYGGDPYTVDSTRFFKEKIEGEVVFYSRETRSDNSIWEYAHLKNCELYIRSVDSTGREIMPWSYVSTDPRNLPAKYRHQIVTSNRCLPVATL